MKPLTNTTALVTGATRGIGRAIAMRLAADGARVGVHYGSSHDAAADVVAEIESHGGSAFAIQATLGRPDDAEQVWNAFDAHADGLDILVNNAGITGGRTPFEDVDAATYEQIFAVNTRAPFFLVQQGLTRLRDGGRIINLSSQLTHGVHVPGLMAYSMAKAAIDAFTTTLAKQVAARGISVNAVGPGVTGTDMHRQTLASAEGREAIAALSPFHRVAQPEDIADVVAFLASPDARWVTGQWLDATGGALL